MVHLENVNRLLESSPTDSDGEVVTSTKSLLNSGNPAQTGQAGRVINICRLADGYSHSFKQRVSEFMNSWLYAADFRQLLMSSLAH